MFTASGDLRDEFRHLAGLDDLPERHLRQQAAPELIHRKAGFSIILLKTLPRHLGIGPAGTDGIDGDETGRRGSRWRQVRSQFTANTSLPSASSARWGNRRARSRLWVTVMRMVFSSPWSSSSKSATASAV